MTKEKPNPQERTKEEIARDYLAILFLLDTSGKEIKDLEEKAKHFLDEKKEK